VVASIEETAERYHISKTFIGLILLPIVANAAEHVTSIWMALKNKMELTITICVGSSIVSCTLRMFLCSPDQRLANRRLRGPFARHRRMDVSPTPLAGQTKTDSLPSTHHELTLYFYDFETIVLFVSVLLVNTLIQ
jgi:Ca2+/H+ antiporter